MRIYGFEEYGGPEVQEFIEVGNRDAQPGTVLVDMRAAGINPADIKVRSGQRQSGFPVSFPMAMGREACGVVIARGGDADAPRNDAEALDEAVLGEAGRAGALVFGSCAPGTGALGEEVLLDAESVTPVPEGVRAEEAACIPVAVGTAYDAVTELGVGEGETLLVLGAGGGVGVHAIQLARAAGAQVCGIASEAKRELVERLGAQHIESGEGWQRRVGEAAGSVDAILDCVGDEVLRDGAALLGPGNARIRSIAAPGEAVGLGGSGVTRRRTTAVFAELADMIAQGVLEVVIDSAVPFAEAPEAVRAVESGHARGKTVVYRECPPAT